MGDLESLVNSLAFPFYIRFPPPYCQLLWTFPLPLLPLWSGWPWLVSIPGASPWVLFFSRLNLYFGALRTVWKCLLKQGLAEWPSLHWLSLLTWARIKSLCSSVPLMHKTKTTSLCSQPLRCENRQVSVGGAEAFVGLKGVIEGCFVCCNGLH